MRQVILLAGLGPAILGCSGSDGPGEPSTPEGPTVSVRNNLFSPQELIVESNDEVRWIWNSGGVEHNVTFDDGPSSSTQGSGAYARTFPEIGTYPYHCTIHGLSMSGTIRVVATGGGGGGGNGGDGGGNGGGGGYGGI